MTKTIRFEQAKQYLFVVYQPELVDIVQLSNKLNAAGSVTIKRVFNFEQHDQVSLNQFFYDENAELAFRFARLENNFWCIQGRVLGIDYDVYITSTLSLKPDNFIASRDISIFRKLSAVVKQDIYIVDDESYQSKVDISEDLDGKMPVSAFVALIAQFPKSTELTRYAHKRIASVVDEFFPQASEAVIKYEQYFDKRKTKLNVSSAIQTKLVWNAEVEKYQLLLETLQDELDKNALSETQWQAKIQDFILLLFPKYIAVLDEITFKDGFLVESLAATRRTDLTLLDVDGHIDLIELKAPSKQLLRTTSYRQNYIPSSELSGSIMQLEKYIFSLASDVKKQQKIIQESKQFKSLGLSEFEVKIVNPKGMLIVGRSKELDTEDKKRDFEIIKRKYANVLDVLTYDDLLNRLKRLIAAMKLKEERAK